MVWSPLRATKTVFDGLATTAARVPASGGGDDRESCGTSRSKAATRSGVTSPATSTVTAATSSDLLGVGNGLGGRRAVVAGARPYQASVGRLLEHVRAPPDGAASRGPSGEEPPPVACACCVPRDLM